MDITEIMQSLKARYWELTEAEQDAVLRMLPEPAVEISTVSDFNRAGRLYGEMEKKVGKGEWRSPAALRLLALRIEIRRFQTNDEAAYGYPPVPCDQDESVPEKWPEWIIQRAPFSDALCCLELIGAIEDSGERRLDRRGRLEIVYVARRREPKRKRVMSALAPVFNFLRKTRVRARAERGVI